jgi:ABC-type spermidine/putrescine transport system permease subunit II
MEFSISPRGNTHIEGDRSSDRDKTGSPAERWLLGLVNAIGLLLYIPLIFGVLMSFDAPGAGKHWGHWVFVVSNVLLGPLCAIALVGKATRYWGLVGFGSVLVGWFVLGAVCNNKFTC